MFTGSNYRLYGRRAIGFGAHKDAAMENRLDSRKLRYFVEAVEQGSLNRAAGSLRVSQPGAVESRSPTGA